MDRRLADYWFKVASNNQKDKVDQAHEDFKKFREVWLLSLSEKERTSVDQEVIELQSALKAASPQVVLSIDMVLEAVFTALYFKRYGETPIQTRLRYL